MRPPAGGCGEVNQWKHDANKGKLAEFDAPVEREKGDRKGTPREGHFLKDI